MKNKSLWVFCLLLVMMVTVTGGCRKSREEDPAPVVERGKIAPDFELQDTTGKTWKLSDLEGQVVFVNFWATWCPPCRDEMPSMQELFEAMPGEQFKMLAILSNDDPAVATAFAAKGGFDFPILIDPGSIAGRAYGITGVPETYIVDKQGVLRQKYLGPRDWISTEARQMLLEYVNR